MSEHPTGPTTSSGDRDTGDLPDNLFDAFPTVPDEAWRDQIEDDLRGADYDDQMVWHTLDGLSIDAYYRRSDLGGLAHVDSETALLATADSSPANDWKRCEDIIHPDPATARTQLLAALDGGATDIGLHLGAHPFPHAGLRVATQDDMRDLLDGVALDRVGLHLRGGVDALIGWSSLLNLAHGRGVDLRTLRGSTDYDPVAALARHSMGDATGAFDLAAQVISYGDGVTPGVKTLAVSAAPFHEAGASTVHELGATLASLSEQWTQATERGVKPGALTNALHFIVPTGTSYFIEIAKLRALRLLVPQVVNAYLHRSDQDQALHPQDVFVQATTSCRDLTVYGPYVNMLRGTTAGAAAVIGGCDVLVVHPYDTAFEPPTGFAQRIARNTQLILKHEAHLDHVADPAAGSYYIEAVTDKLAHAAWSYFQDIEAQGGILDALTSGRLQDTIAADREQRSKEIADRTRVLVGTNHYPDPEDSKRNDLADPAEARTDEANTPADLDADDLIASIRTAMAGGAVIGQLKHALTGDRTPEWAPLPFYRPAEAFEAVRLRTETHAASHGSPPVVFILPIGHRAQRSARATFARNVFGCAGFKLMEDVQFDSISDGAEAALNAEADIVVLCSSDSEYAEFAPPLCQRLSDAGSDALIVVAGHPKDDVDALREAGVDRFIHRRSLLLDELRFYQDQLGMDDPEVSRASP